MSKKVQFKLHYRATAWHFTLCAETMKQYSSLAYIRTGISCSINNLLVIFKDPQPRAKRHSRLIRAKQEKTWDRPVSNSHLHEHRSRPILINLWYLSGVKQWSTQDRSRELHPSCFFGHFHIISLDNCSDFLFKIIVYNTIHTWTQHTPRYWGLLTADEHHMFRENI